MEEERDTTDGWLLGMDVQMDWVTEAWRLFLGRKGWECAAVLSEKIMGQTANGFFALGRSALHALQLACGVSAQCIQEAPHCWARQRSIEYSYQEIERARLERF